MVTRVTANAATLIDNIFGNDIIGNELIQVFVIQTYPIILL